MPFVAYADFESFTEPVYGCNPDSKSSYTSKYQKHEPSGFCLYVKCFDDSVGFNMEPIVYSKQKDENISLVFVKELEKITREICKKYYKNGKEMIISKEEINFQKSETCYLCNNKYAKNCLDKVKDHCHFTGKYRGAACASCNMNKLRKPRLLPVIFHNFSDYDSHLFIKELSSINENKNENITCIPITEEKYYKWILALNLKFVLSILSNLWKHPHQNLWIIFKKKILKF